MTSLGDYSLRYLWESLHSSLYKKKTTTENDVSSCRAADYLSMSSNEVAFPENPE